MIRMLLHQGVEILIGQDWLLHPLKQKIAGRAEPIMWIEDFQDKGKIEAGR